MNRVRLIGLVVLVAVVARIPAADPPLPRHHLVGHEEALLLARVQDVIDDWDPRKLVNPLVETSQATNPDGTVVTRKQLRRPDLAQFVADIDAMEALGKAFFWDMQAGSDFRRTADNEYVGTACATCHYKHGADGRTRHSRSIPYVAWDKYKLDAPGHTDLGFGQRQEPFDVRKEATKQYTPSDYELGKSPFSLVIGSQGVEPRIFDGIANAPTTPGAWESEKSRKRLLAGYKRPPQWSMFVGGQQDAEGPDNLGKRYRQITTRNSPSVANSAFADRLFHDGRAESTFNGFSIFGDSDKREVLHRANITKDAAGQDVYGLPIAVRVAITKAALASQAVGPIVNDVEMSYLGRTFPNLAHKLLPATPLAYQEVSDSDDILGPWKTRKVLAADKTWSEVKYVGHGGNATYRELIKRAFRRDWWDGRKADGTQHDVPLVLHRDPCSSPDAPDPLGELMAANFSLYWGLSVMFYEATLVSNQSPFDDMMRGRPEAVNARWEALKGQLGPIKLDRVPYATAPPHANGASVFQHGMRVFVSKGCVECHSGPLFSEIYERKPEVAKFPIHFQMERVLLPNSKADALALKYQDEREKMLADVRRLVAPLPKVPANRAGAVARHLDTLREIARGDKAALTNLVRQHLDLSLSADTPAKVAERLLRFETTVASRLGDRAFFGEDERVALADTLTEPLLVELMKIPPRQVATRPRLPIGGVLAREAYAFYDLGFYALGVSPPRYDRGIGEQSDFPETEEEVIEQVISRLRQPAPKGVAPAAEADRAALLKFATDVKAAAPAARAELVAKPPPGTEALAAEIQQRTATAADRSRTTSTPGQAYQFKRQWSVPKGEKAPPAPGARPLNAGVPAACDPDQDARQWNGPDASWDRQDLPPGTRRADMHFRSRARRQVTTEDPWGYRKPFLHDNELAFWGAFKTPTLRNVELTAPYMHNGRLMSLMDVVDFYEHDEEGERVRFIPRDLHGNQDKDPEIVLLKMTPDDKRALVFFLMCLTDERVRLHRGPFARPSLRIPHGYAADGRELYDDIPLTK